MKLSRLVLLALLAGALTVLGCGESDDGGGAGSAGTGGTAGTGGSAGTGGTGGTAGTGGTGAFAITPGAWSSWAGQTSVCLFVNEDATALVPDGTCSQNGIGLVERAFEFRTNQLDGPTCGVSYPIEDETPSVPIVNNQFELEFVRGSETLKFSGTFTGSDSVTGFVSNTFGCPMDQPWSAASGLCSRCW